MTKKLIINCKTGKKQSIDLTPEEEAQRIIDNNNNQQREQEENVKLAEDKKINDEIKALAIKSLQDKGEL